MVNSNTCPEDFSAAPAVHRITFLTLLAQSVKGENWSRLNEFISFSA